MTIITKSYRATAAPAQARLDIRFPQRGLKDVRQDDEWCELIEGERVTRIRFHDYAQVYSIPGLYNQLFGGPDSETKCISPQVMAGLLREQLPLVLQNDRQKFEQRHEGGKPSLRVLDLGAGNGIMGEEIRSLARSYEGGMLLAGDLRIVGLDILPEAKFAAEYERPGVYDGYVAADITEYVKAAPRDPAEAMLFAQGFNVLTSVSSLTFGDGSVRAFKAAVSLVEEGGLLMFNLREDLFDLVDSVNGVEATATDGNGFSGLIHSAIDQGCLSIVAKRRYCHRYSVTGAPLYYVAVVTVKLTTLR